MLGDRLGDDQQITTMIGECPIWCDMIMNAKEKGSECPGITQVSCVFPGGGGEGGGGKKEEEERV